MTTSRLLFVIVLLLLPAAAESQQTDPGAGPDAAPQSGTDTDININARYIVEAVETSGIDEARIRQERRDALQGLVGQRFDPETARELERRLESDLPGFKVRHAVERGSEPGRVRVVFRFAYDDNRHIAISPSKVVYHADQGWSTVVEVGAGRPRDTEFRIGFVRFNNDDLIEEYTGFYGRLEMPHAARSPFGLSIELSRFTQHWEGATLSALADHPGIPEPYDIRRTIRPAFMISFAPQLRLTVGTSLTRLDPLAETSVRQDANAAFAALRYDQWWSLGEGAEQRLAAAYEVRSATTALGSDLVYRRHHAQARYEYEHGRGLLIADGSFGFLSGRAPLFERFSLGDTATLRGWNKYDLAPAGGTRVFHQSIEYRYRRFAYFVDAGSVWNDGEDLRIRVATGIGWHRDNSFVTLGFPVNDDDVRATFMAGVRF